MVRALDLAISRVRGFGNSPEIRRLADLKLNELMAALAVVRAVRMLLFELFLRLVYATVRLYSIAL